MRYYIRMTTPLGIFYWNGNQVDQYEQLRPLLIGAQLYQRKHLAERKASQLRTAIGRLWVVEGLEVVTVSPTGDMG